MTDDPLLSAWLADDLDDAEAAALEARLAADPVLARRLDEVADAVAGLRRLDDVEPPPGLDDRLRTRVARERAEGDGAVSLDAARQRRRRWTGRIAKPLSAAAAVALLAVVGASAVAVLGGGGGGDTAQEEAAPLGGAAGDREVSGQAARAEGPVVLEGPLPEVPSATAGSGAAAEAAEEETEAAETEAGDEASADDGADPDAQPDAGAPLAAPPPEGGGLLSVPEIEAVRGLDLEAAAARAEEYRAALAAAPPFSTGTRPEACLDVVTADATGPLVAVRVQATTAGGAPALAHVLVGASAGSPVLDRVEVWITDPSTCATRSFLQG